MQEKDLAGGTRRRVSLPPFYNPVQFVGAVLCLLAFYLFRANGPSPLTAKLPFLGEPWVPWSAAMVGGAIVLANGWRVIRAARERSATRPPAP